MRNRFRPVNINPYDTELIDWFNLPTSIHAGNVVGLRPSSSDSYDRDQKPIDDLAGAKPGYEFLNVPTPGGSADFTYTYDRRPGFLVTVRFDLATSSAVAGRVVIATHRRGNKVLGIGHSEAISVVASQTTHVIYTRDWTRSDINAGATSEKFLRGNWVSQIILYGDVVQSDMSAFGSLQSSDQFSNILLGVVYL